MDKEIIKLEVAAMTGNVSDTIIHDAIVAHLDKITALYSKEPTTVIRKGADTLVRQYGEFEYEQIKGGFERSKNLVLIEEVNPSSLRRQAFYTMSSDSYGKHPNGPYVKFWDNGNIRSYENRTVRLGSDNEFESDMLSFTREGIVQEKIPGDYSIKPFLEDITSDYMKTIAQKEEASKENANKADSDVLSTHLDKKQEKREALRKKERTHYGNIKLKNSETKGIKMK